MSAAGQPVSLTGVRSALSRLSLLWPTLITALWLTLLVVPTLAGSGWNAYVFVQFGHRLAHWMQLPAGAPIVPAGFDGQFYWLQATDPLLRHQSTIIALSHLFPGYHLQRVAYPALAWLLSAGHASLLPWTMLGINVIAVLGITQAFAVYAQRRGWNPTWALAVGMVPGFVMPVLRDMSDVLAMACLLGGLLLWRERRAWWAGLLFAVAVLSREPMLLIVVAIAVELSVSCVRARRDRRAVLAILRVGWPAAVLPALAFEGWQQYLHTLDAPLAAAAEAPVWPPFNDFLVTTRLVIESHAAGQIAFVILFFVITLWGFVLSFANLRYGATAAIVMAPLLALTLPVLVFGADYWSMMRYPAPMFMVLLLTGLERRSRTTLTACGAMAAMSLLVPVLL